MKVIGITGGVGSGKSEVLKLIDSMTKCVIVKADDLARSLEVRGEACFAPLVELLGEGRGNRSEKNGADDFRRRIGESSGQG